MLNHSLLLTKVLPELPLKRMMNATGNRYPVLTQDSEYNDFEHANSIRGVYSFRQSVVPFVLKMPALSKTGTTTISYA